MDNPEKMATLGTQETGWRQTKQKHNTDNWKYEEHVPHQQPGVNPGARQG
jgi:hypothetical protein